MRAELASGRLVPVLEREVGQVVPVSLVYAAGAQLSPKVRSFLDFAAAWTEKLDVDASDETSSRAGAATGS
jgi:DNA-binding transcriptional LysR family regulator